MNKMKGFGLLMLVAVGAVVAGIGYIDDKHKQKKDPNYSLYHRKDGSLKSEYEVLASVLCSHLNDGKRSIGKEKIMYHQMLKIMELPIFDEYVNLCEKLKFHNGKEVMMLDDIVNDLNENDLESFIASFETTDVSSVKQSHNIVEFFIDSNYLMEDLFDYYDYESESFKMVKDSYYKRHALNSNERSLEKINEVCEYCDNICKLNEIRKEIIKYYFSLDDFNVVDLSSIESEIPFYKANNITDIHKTYNLSEKDFKIVKL